MIAGTVVGAARADAAHRSAAHDPRTGRSGYLLGVTITDHSNVWAVGYHNPLGRPLVEHKNPTWRTAHVKVHQSYLAAVASSRPKNVWTVGSVGNRALTLHWNGHHWKRFSAPSPGVEPELNGVSVLSKSDAWAVGGYLDDSAEKDRTLVEHWDGDRWSRVDSPSRGYTELAGVSFNTGDDGWAVGGSLALHWTGTAWRAVHVPASMHGLTAVDALSADDVWAVGDGIYHWDGTKWSKLPRPGRRGTFAGVAASSARNAWAVGSTCGSSGHCATLTLHWNGHKWQHVPSPNPSGSDTLTAVSVIGQHAAWAVGSATGHPAGQQVALHWDGTKWRVG